MDGEQPSGPTPPISVPLPVQGSSSHSGSRPDSGRGSRSLKSLTRLLGDEREAKEWKELVQKLHNQLQLERRRAEDAERRVLEIASHLKSVNDSRLQALQDVARLNEELKLYEIQFDKAQKEIYRAQDVLKIVDDQRYRAEHDAAKARSSVRKLKEEITIYEAREEGRRLGIQEGLRKGREMGYQEGRRMAEARRARGRSDWEDSLDEESPDSHAPSPGEAVESQARPRAPSSASSRTPTVHHGAPPTAAPPGSSVQPVPPIPEEPEDIHPRSARNASPTPRMPASSVPPDNFIPSLDEDNRIRLPPAFEFSHPLPSPERQRSPALPTTSENEEPRMIPPPVATSQRSLHYRPTSLASASTALSQLDIVNDPYTGRTPMSAIPEALSAQGSPNPQETNLRRQPSIGTQSSRIASRSPTNLESHYGRPRTGSGSTISFQPPVIPGFDPRASVSSASSTAPNITVQPPSLPTSRFTSASSEHAHDPARSSSYTDQTEQFLPPIPDMSPQSTEPVPLPGSLPMQSAYAMNTSIDNANQPPVIPHADLYGDGDDDDAISSGMGSMESLTTPPGRYQGLSNRDRFADGGEGAFDGGSGFPGENHWAGIARMAAHEPIRPVVPPAYPPVASSARTPSNKGRPLSRSTNRSGQ